MKIRQKLSDKIRRTGREADLGEKEAKLEKTQAELEQGSKDQLSHMGGALNQKAKIERMSSG